MFTISPSIYSADLLDLKEVLDKTKSFEHIHLDIDDGNFVKGISFGTEMVKQIAAYTDVPLDVHLEVINPLDHLDELGRTKVVSIAAHIETLPYPSLFISRVHQYGKKAGLALNLKTPVSFIRPYLDQLDYLLFVSVEADVEGLPFRSGVLEKISEARSITKDLEIWVDGGINEENLKDVIKAGVDGAVIGRAVFGKDDYVKAYEDLLAKGMEYELKYRGE